MGKRLFCLVCAAMLVVASLFGIRAFAEPGISIIVPYAREMALAKVRVNLKSNPLVSAMFLVLAGVGISMLFDKKK